ncbi:hypothetical protein CF70_015635 [Cupriavidus sp. SK-3]|nr:hypothetical protein CF70_015635 [Cupriavidus sp. SK-3]
MLPPVNTQRSWQNFLPFIRDHMLLVPHLNAIRRHAMHAAALRACAARGCVRSCRATTAAAYFHGFAAVLLLAVRGNQDSPARS